MPELPEVETVMRGMVAEAAGSTISSISHIAPHLAQRDPNLRSLVGDAFIGFSRRGKYIQARLRSGRQLLIHLRMTGQILFVAKNYRRTKHDHFVAMLSRESKKLVFRDTRKFGVFEFLSNEQSGGFHNLGIEATEIRVPGFARLLQLSSRPIKAFLLDQSMVAGLGNIYVDESLYRSNIHPSRPACQVTAAEAGKLTRNIRSILKMAVKNMGTTFDSYRGVNGNPGEFARYLRVYNQDGTKCRVCGNIIIKIRVAGRGTHVCPGCQK